MCVDILDDIKYLNSTPDRVSPVVKINDQDAAEYMETLSDSQTYQDPDARYNDGFFSLSRFTSPSTMLGGFYSGAMALWPGTAKHTLEYANGTTSDSTVIGGYSYDDGFPYANGREVYEDYCLPATQTSSTSSPTSTPTSTSTSTSTSSASASATPKPAPTGYPEAVIRDKNNFLAGYLPSEPPLQDTAVLSVPTFSVTDDEEDTYKVSNLAVRFIQKAKAEGRKKIILDLVSNPGGDLIWAYDLFTLFFPNKLPYASTRFRAHDALYLLGKVGYSIPEDTDEPHLREIHNTGYFNMKTPNQSYTFQSADEFYGPHSVLGANLTSAASDNYQWFSEPMDPIHGYGGVKNNYTTAPFAPEDILILTDGACSSSCPLFTKLMSEEGVRTVTFGGRPQYGPMQSMGGTRGGEVLDGESLVNMISGAHQIANATGILTDEELQTLKELSPAVEPPLMYSSVSVNLRNSYARDDEESLMPLQFVYKPADCRLFYTLENIFRPSTTWAAAARAIWGEGNCVAGSQT